MRGTARRAGPRGFYHGETAVTTVYRGTILHSLAPDRFQCLPAAELTVGADGRVVSLAEGTQTPPRDATLGDRTDRLILPGLVDAHFHIPQIDVIGIASSVSSRSPSTTTFSWVWMTSAPK